LFQLTLPVFFSILIENESSKIQRINLFGANVSCDEQFEHLLERTIIEEVPVTIIRWSENTRQGEVDRLALIEQERLDRLALIERARLDKLALEEARLVHKEEQRKKKERKKLENKKKGKKKR
jgi:hypothetical protein